MKFITGFSLGVFTVMQFLYMAGDTFGCSFPDSIVTCVEDILNYD